MRLLPVFALPFLVTVLSAAQPGGQPSGAPFNSQQNALGGRYGAVGMGRPLGGITPPAQRHEGSRRGNVAAYGYAWYVPGYFESTPSTVAVYSADTPPAPPPPVIVNQYYSAPPPPPAEQPSPAPVENTYYLIAFKDRSVYSVVAYWVEDKTLHYVTTKNTHNQASLDLIDLDLTRTLNSGTERRPQGSPTP
jgi:hypothetical protein